MKNLKLPSSYTLVERAEQNSLGGGSGIVSASIYAAAKFVFPEDKIAGESRGGYYPTFILVPEAVLLDYAALRAAKLLYRAASFLDEIGL